MKKFYLLALVAAMFAACATDATEDVAIEAPETLKVSFEESSRIQLDDNKTVWTKGDLVSVFYRSDANQQWKFQGNTGDRSGTIKRVSTPEYSHTTSKMVVVYPYNENYYLNPETCNLQAFLPAEQTYLKDSYGINGNIMVSQSEYKQFVLKSVCGWLKIQLKGEGQVVKKVILKGNNGEQVAGEIYVNTADATSILAAEMGFSSDDTQVGGTMVEDDTILTEVTLDCGNGVTLGSESTAFYIALPPQEFSKGLTLKVLYADGTTMTKSTSNSIEIARNTILPMSTLYYDGNVPPVYELAYTTNDGEPLDPYITEGFGANFVENIFDPATGKGALKFDGRVTTIPARAFVACTNLTQIELTKDITVINAEAFSGCAALTVMDIPQGVKTIGDKAFYNCNGMTEITIPSSVTSIGTSSFEGCGGKANINCKIAGGNKWGEGKFCRAKFTDVILGGNITSIGSFAFEDCGSITSVIIPDSVTSIANFAFYYCSALKNITIPDSLTVIGKYVFEGCPLTKLTIPNNITSIGHGSFANCYSLKEVHYIGKLSDWCKINFGGYTANPMNNGAKLYLNGVELTEATIPSDVTEINYTFHGCTSLKSVTLHKRITSIGEYTFSGCTSLASVTIPDSVTKIGDSAFNRCTSLTSITIPDSVTSIGVSAFSDCTSLISVTIPDSVTSIGERTFYNCTSLTSATIPDSVTSIGSDAFINCTSLTSVTIPDSVTEIGCYAFGNCTSLTSITIPDSVTSIEGYAFYYCTSLKEVYCKPTTPPSGGSSMFSSNVSGRKIYVPRASVDAYKAASGWSSYKSYIEPYDFE